MTNKKRIPFGMRVTQELRGKVEKAAADSGRSLAQEIEYRLERSFWGDDLANLERCIENLTDMVMQLDPHSPASAGKTYERYLRKMFGNGA